MTPNVEEPQSEDHSASNEIDIDESPSSEASWSADNDDQQSPEQSARIAKLALRIVDPPWRE